MNFLKHYIWSYLLCKPTDSNDDLSSDLLSFKSSLAVQTSWAEVKRTGARVLLSSHQLKVTIKSWQSHDRRWKDKMQQLSFVSLKITDANVETVWSSSEHKTKSSSCIGINQQRAKWMTDLVSIHVLILWEFCAFFSNCQCDRTLIIVTRRLSTNRHWILELKNQLKEKSGFQPIHLSDKHFENVLIINIILNQRWINF